MNPIQTLRHAAHTIRRAGLALPLRTRHAASLLAAIFSFATATAVMAQDEAAPVITFKTNFSTSDDGSTAFHFYVGGNGGGYFDVDCGYGKVEYELEVAAFDSTTQTITGTLVTCQGTDDGIVRVYADDPEAIDYFSAEGCYIEWIEMSRLTNLAILELENNELARLDLTPFHNLEAAYLGGNPYDETPLIVGPDKPNLYILDISVIDNLDASFNLSDYPSMRSFCAFNVPTLRQLDPTGCPELLRISIDVTNVESIDVSKNTNLMILNVSDTRISELDLSHNEYLQELYCTRDGEAYHPYKLTTLDVTGCPWLYVLFASGNALTELDLSQCPYLFELNVKNNLLTTLDFSANTGLYNVYFDGNCMDFATMPFLSREWGDATYTQRAMPAAPSYAVGSAVDFSERVMRDFTNTYAAAYACDEKADTAYLISADTYDYEDGVFVFKTSFADSVYLAFTNDSFPDMTLCTEKFMVKTAEAYGQDDEAFRFTTTLSVGQKMALRIGMDGATAAAPVRFSVDFGDGTFKDFYAATDALPAAANATGTRSGNGAVVVRVPEGALVTALEVRDVPMTTVDVTAMHALRTLHLTGAELYAIDLTWNRALVDLDLTGGNLTSLNLDGFIGSYNKGGLRTVNLSHNALTTFTLSEWLSVREMNLSHNKLSDISFDYGENLTTLDVSYNDYVEIDISDCDSLRDLDVSYNHLTALALPDEATLRSLHCQGNALTIATLPDPALLDGAEYVYAPQNDYIIPTKGPGVNLSGEYREIGGAGTVFTWRNAAGEALVEGVDYTCDHGKTTFLNTEAGIVRCEMTHAALPAFAGADVFKTTDIEAAGMPTHVIAEFTTLRDDEMPNFVLAASVAGAAVYADWSGDTTALEQYVLGTTYRIFNPTTHAGHTVRVYSYDETDNVTVFSLTGATLGCIDASALKGLMTFNVSGAGLADGDIILPQSPGLRELILDDNKLTGVDITPYADLRTLTLSNNMITSVDLSAAKTLQVISFARNQLADITLDNPNVWSLDLCSNQLTTIDLSRLPQLYQFNLGDNQLSAIDISMLNELHVVYVEGNRFTFSTLPLPSSDLWVYHYEGQQALEVTPVDGRVDLSEQAVVGGVATTYRWFAGMPTYDDNGNLTGTELDSTDFVITDGVTEFLHNVNDAVCIMTNDVFSSLTLYTAAVDITGVNGINMLRAADGVSVRVDGLRVFVDAAAGTPVTLCSVDGSTVAQLPPPQGRGGERLFRCPAAGVYIVTAGSTSAKVLVK